MNCARPDLWEAGSGNWPVDPTFRDQPLAYPVIDAQKINPVLFWHSFSGRIH